MIKTWWATVQQRRIEKMRDKNRKLMESLINDPSSGMKHLIAQRAAEVASSMVMKWMDDKRIRHCRLCPDTDTMRMFRNVPLCNVHYQPVVDESLKQDAKIKAEKDAADAALSKAKPVGVAAA